MPIGTVYANSEWGWTTTVLVWALQILAAVAFFAAGSAKLAGARMMVEVFDKIGLGQWFRYFTAGVEILCAVALLVPSTAAFGAILLAITMACGVLAHLTVLGGNPIPALVLLVVTGTIVWLRWDDVQGALIGLR